MSAVDASAPIVVGPAPPTSFSLRDIPNPHAPGSGPIRVENYPPKLDAGMSDPASAFGYFRDGKTYAYCQFDACCRSDQYSCVLYDENDKPHSLVSPILFGDLTKPTPDVEKRGIKELLDLPKAEGLATLGPRTMSDYTQKPPPLTGTIPYGNELTLVYQSIAPTALPDGNVKIPGAVKIGARLAGENAVYVAFPPYPDFCKTTPIACFHAELNGISLTPDGDELAFLVFQHLPSHGAQFSHMRIKTTAFAALVFNDTGMAHHEKKEWARAAELFTRAVYADPTKELFAYNLACALARQSDARAEHALEHAISIGGDAVKKRASADADFEAVRTTDWFKTAIQ